MVKHLELGQFKGFSKKLEGKLMTTKSRGPDFYVNVFEDFLEFIPASSGIARKEINKNIVNVLEHFNATGSLQSKDYLNFTYNSVYLITIMEAYGEFLSSRKQKIVYVDMDNVLVDFQSGINKLSEDIKKEYSGKLDEVPHIFSLMQPMPKAIESYQLLAEYYDTYILSTAPWDNSSAWHDKIVWVKLHLGKVAYKRLILSHHKHLNKGDYLIDDRNAHNGSDKFTGEFIHFASAKFPDWDSVVEHLIGFK